MLLLDWPLLTAAVLVPLVILVLVTLDRRAGGVPRELELFYSFLVVPACFGALTAGLVFWAWFGFSIYTL